MNSKKPAVLTENVRMSRPTRVIVIVVVFGGSLGSSSWLPSQDGSWTDRLGLRFTDDCQEEVGLAGLLSWLLAWVTRGGQQRSGHCESREMRCAVGQKLTGLQVRYARLERGDRDLYDFRPRCGTAWQAWLGLRFPDAGADHMQSEAAICHDAGASVTGVQVMRGRNDRRDQDYYNFKLRCGKQWAAMPLGLAFDGLRETRSATCPVGSATAGLRVHRGFQDWGDVDTYEFQLFCTAPPPKGGRNGVSGGVGDEAMASVEQSGESILDGTEWQEVEEMRRAASARRDSRSGNGGGSSSQKKGGREGSERRARRKGSKGGRRRHGEGTDGREGKRSSSATATPTTSSPRNTHGGGGGGGASTFGSRAAQMEAAAEEVRRELARDAEARRNADKDEL